MVGRSPPRQLSLPHRVITLRGETLREITAGESRNSARDNTYTLRYRTNSPARAETKAGEAHDELMLRLVNGELLIVSQRQQVLGVAN